MDTLNKITDRIFQNGYPTVEDSKALVELGITDLLNVDREYPEDRSRLELGLNLHNYFVPDVTPIEHDLAVRIIAEMHSILASPKAKIYVHCEVGHNRSPTIVWLYLVSAGYKREEATNIVKSQNKLLVVPNRLLVSELDLAKFENWEA